MADDGVASAAPIVLIAPAMAIGSGYYRPLVEEFERRGWKARALGRRGFEKGQPRASRAEDWTYRDEIDDIARAIAAARAEAPGRPVLVLGHSLGGQLVAGHELTQSPADGVVTIGGAIPHYRRFRYGGIHLAVMAASIVPVATALLGYLPKPAFGGPGARSFMRQWARMVLTGRPPFATGHRIRTPSLVVSFGDDRLSPEAAVDDLARLRPSRRHPLALHRGRGAAGLVERPHHLGPHAAARRGPCDLVVGSDRSRATDDRW